MRAARLSVRLIFAGVCAGRSETEPSSVYDVVCGRAVAQPPPACSQIARAVAWLPLSNREQVEGPTPCQLPVQTGSVPSEQEDTRSWTSQISPHLDQARKYFHPHIANRYHSKPKLITRSSTHRWCRKSPLCKPATRSSDTGTGGTLNALFNPVTLNLIGAAITGGLRHGT